MSSKNIAVFGIYPDRRAVEEGVEHLRRAGFRPTDVSALFPENMGSKDFGHEKSTKAPEGAVLGAIIGVVLGAVFGWLVASGVLNVPALMPYFTGGPIVAALACAGGAGIIAGMAGAVAGSTVPEYEARRYEGRVRDGGILLSVHCDSSEWVKRAKGVMVTTGAEEIAATTEKRGDFANADKPMPRVRTTVSSDDELFEE